MRFLGGGDLDRQMAALVDHSPAVLRFVQSCGIPFRLVQELVDLYFGVAAGARGAGRSVEVELISGFDLGAWRDKVACRPTLPVS